MNPRPVAWPSAHSLDELDSAALDALECGVVELDGRGIVVRYSAAEARMSGLSPSDVIGRPFFEQIAPCTAVPEFEGRFKRGVERGDLEAEFEFDFNFVLSPVRVAVRLQASHRPDRYWLTTRVVARNAPEPERTERADLAWQRNLRRDLDLAGTDEDECASEPIQHPAAIQPFGCLLVVEASSGTVCAADEHAQQLFRLAPEELLGRPCETVLPRELAAVVERIRSRPDLADHEHLVLERDALLQVDAYVHRWDGRVLVELVPKGVSEPVLSRLSHADTRIQNAPPDATWQAACDEVAAITGYERVLGYAMEDSGDGLVVAETLLHSDPSHSLLGLRFPASDIPPQARQLYVRNRARFCPNVDYTPARLKSVPGTREVDLSFAQLRSLSPYHIQYQRNLGVHSASSFSVVVEGALRGLLICHHFRPLNQTHEQRHAAAMVAQFLGRALTSAQRREESERQVKRTSAYAAVIHKLASWDVGTAPDPTTVHDLAHVFDADGAAVQLGNQLWCSSPEHIAWAKRAIENVAPQAVRAPVALSRRDPELGEDSELPVGVLVVAPPTTIGLRLLAFRHARTDQKIWGRGSETLPGAVERWVESRAATARSWSRAELDLARALHRDLEKTLGPLAETRHLLQRVIETAPMGVVLCAEDGTIVGHNPPAHALLDSGELAGTRLDHYVQGWTPEVGEQPELEIPRPDGQNIPVRVHTVQHDLGRVARLVFLQDLRAIRALEAHLAEAKRIEVAATLASGLAHDFNNALAVILGQASMLQEDLPNDDHLRRLAADIVEAAHEGRDIAHEMLAFARSDSRSKDQTTSLSRVVRESRRMLGALVGKRLRLELVVPDDDLVVPLSRGQARQVLFNLVGNARDAAASRIDVRLARLQDGTVQLEVHDDGPGFGKDILDRVFDPFFTTKPRTRGTGLGLYTVAGIVRGAGGEVGAANDHGGVVRVLLPKATGHSPSTPAPTPPRAEPRGQNIRVLLVEDNAALRRSLGEALRRLQFRVEDVGSGEEALERIQAAPPDVLVTDYSMAGMSGLDLVDAIADLDLPAVVLTGLGLTVESGSHVQVLAKPVRAATLATAITDALERHRKRSGSP